MNTSLTTTQQPRLSYLPREWQTRITSLRNFVEFDRKYGCIVLPTAYYDLALNESQRRWLEQRVLDLERVLVPAGADMVRGQVTSMGVLMKHRNYGGALAFERVLDAYIADLEDIPIYGLHEACRAFRQHAIGDGWMPDPGAVRKEAIIRASWPTRELSDIKTILDAKVLPARPAETAEHRRAVVAQCRASIAEAALAARMPAEKNRAGLVPVGEGERLPA